MIGHVKVDAPRCSRSRWKAPRTSSRHGGEAFPSVIVVLQGYGVTVDVVGDDVHQQNRGSRAPRSRPSPTQPFSELRTDASRGAVFGARGATGTSAALTKTVTVKKKVTVKVKGHKKTEMRKVKETQAASLSMPTEFVAQNGARHQADHPDRCHGLREGCTS